jgi:hypothetical protein
MRKKITLLLLDQSNVYNRDFLFLVDMSIVTSYPL